MRRVHLTIKGTEPAAREAASTRIPEFLLHEVRSEDSPSGWTQAQVLVSEEGRGRLALALNRWVTEPPYEAPYPQGSLLLWSWGESAQEEYVPSRDERPWCDA